MFKTKNHGAKHQPPLQMDWFMRRTKPHFFCIVVWYIRQHILYIKSFIKVWIFGKISHPSHVLLTRRQWTFISDLKKKKKQRQKVRMIKI